jgi:membrane-associated protease RseP (regulator of RpoE activity)
MGQEIEKLLVEVERPIFLAARIAYWILFVVFGVVLAAIGWALYTFVLYAHPIPGGDHVKDIIIVVLAAIVLTDLFATVTRDKIANAIAQRILRRGKK